ncbi:efflux RND transporter permease subunit [Paludisphaera mucosa]|uniref:CusA/CzcA family heavy metal efflux RND transporter n=1 Tax=Paludisphaera mucosa TaxID=3030827 RepID=A0ABT6FKU1_9BACT|nr:CusA/CzcA family heavy metal efflux RND transporter [Paludisphaera mucosa]
MVRAIIFWSLHNRLIVILGAFALIGVGAYSAANLNVEAYPDPTPPLVEVISQNPGASPEEMERLVGIPVETALNGMPGLEYLRSTSIAGLNDVKCQFAYGTDYGAARQEVLNRLAAVDLPAGVKPGLSPWSPTGEIIRYVLEGPAYTTNQLKAVQDWVVNRTLKQVPGVIDVVGFGGTVKQYQVLLDTRLLKQYGVTMQQVEDAIARSNANVGGDLLTLGTQAHNVRAVGLLGGGRDPLDPANLAQAPAIEAEKLDDIRDVIITSAQDGTPIFVRQVAKVIVGNRPRLGIVGRGGEDDVVEGIVMMRKGEKSLPTAEAVVAKIEEMEREKLLPEGMRIRAFNQRTDLVHVTTHNVLHNLLIGVGLVVAVLFVFLGDLASAAIVALVIPLALLFAISVLFAQGRSANLLSIGAVDFGIIVDSSVIIVETIYRHITEPGADRSRPLIDRIAEASHGVERPIFFSTMIIICAFVPLFAMSGPAGALFGPMAATYAFSILGALLVSLTLAPVLCSIFFRNKTEEKDTLVDRALKSVYSAALRGALGRRPIVLLASAGLLAYTISLLPGLGAEFMPELEEGNLWIRALMPRTVSREEAARMAPRLRRVIASVPEVRGVMSQVGRPDDGTDVTSFFNVEFNVPLRPMEEWRPGMTRKKLEAELTAKFADFPGLSFSFSQLIRDNIDEALSGIKGANSVKLFGGELEKLEEVGQRVVNALRAIPGIENVGLFHIVGQPNLEVRIDRRACARYGVNVEDVEDVVQVAIGGRAFSEMVEGEKRYEIVLRFPQDLRDDPDDIGRIPVDLPGRDGKPGARIPLSHLAAIEPHKSGAAYIYRENNRRYIPIKFSVHGRDLASAIEEARRKVDDPASGAKLPPGYRVEWSGEFAQMQEANRRLMVTVPLSIVLILVLLYTMFSSMKDALLVMAGVVTAMMGGIWALRLTGTAFSISAAVGFISIFGVVVQNGVLLVNDYNRMRAAGVPVRETVERGSTALLRPVVMISLTAILGLLPAALADSVGSQAQKPLAIVVVGGMFVAMFLPQFLIPVLYTYFPARGPSPAEDL